MKGANKDGFLILSKYHCSNLSLFLISMSVWVFTYSKQKNQTRYCRYCGRRDYTTNNTHKNNYKCESQCKTNNPLALRNEYRKYQPSGAGGTRSPPATPHRLQRRTAYKINNGHEGAPKWPTGSGKRLNLRLFDPPINFRLISFLIRSFLLWEPQKFKMVTWGPQNGQRGLERGEPLGFLELPSTFSK